MIINGPVRFGDFIILYRIGSGGMGEVYRAVKIGPGGFEKDVALKVINSDISSDSEFRKMFMKEAKISAKIQHPNVIAVYELGMAGGTLYMAMELVRGVTLKRFMNAMNEKGIKFSEDEVAYVLYYTSLALLSAHNFEDTTDEVKKVIHRDVTPHNIFITYGGEVKLGDFGVAKVVGYTEVTQPGVVKGKLSYMAPEQLRGEEVDERSDFFSLGIVAFEMLTGKKPFTTLDVGSGEVRREMKRFPFNFSEAFEEFFLKTMNEDKEKRFRSAEEICELLSKNFNISKGKEEICSKIKQLFSDLKKEEEEKEKFLKQAGEYRVLKGEILHRLGGEKTVLLGVKKRKIHPYLLVLTLGISVSAFIIFFTHLLKKESLPPQKVMEISPEKYEVPLKDKNIKEVMNDEVKAEEKKGELKNLPSKNERGGAILTIYAEPWGYVFINGKNTNLRTPVEKMEIEPGVVTIAVVNPESGIVGMERVNLRRGEKKKIFMKK